MNTETLNTAALEICELSYEVAGIGAEEAQSPEDKYATALIVFCPSFN